MLLIVKIFKRLENWYELVKKYDDSDFKALFTSLLLLQKKQQQ